ncbi:AbrB family transcriptional regulator [Bacillus sp. FJAT-45350]|uniref:AbrB family transcriptional regulator n=1 Tax=Bacillus sp. FJAT-45350 TaxID=2011014 RepID=UPI000BB71E47|nr:AbrB family transcriptional regulator [Bacillus sp. FJAT-45350]
MQKILYLITAIVIGWIFASLKIPAGWLLGSLVTGIAWAFCVKNIIFSTNAFKLALSIVGCIIGFMIVPEQFLSIQYIIGPFLMIFILTLFSSLLLGIILKKYTGLHPNTAMFCCLPGGAAEVIAISKEYGADQRMVAAFHTTRITVFLLIIPLIVGIYGFQKPPVIAEKNFEISFIVSSIFIIATIVVCTLWLSERFKFPGSPLVFSIILGFIAVQWIVPTHGVPSIMTGIAQSLMGAIIGIQFDKKTFIELKKIGLVSVVIIILFFGMSLFLSTIFYLITPLGFMTSLLSTVPAGSGEMASTAAALGIDPTVVATLQILRVLGVLFALPFLIKWLAKKESLYI